MRFSSEEFRASREKAAKEQELASTWPVYANIEVHAEGERTYLHAPPGASNHDLDRRYSPLQDVPDLFLRFARFVPVGLDSYEDLLEITLEWVKSYGALGSRAMFDIRPVDAPQTLDYSAHPERMQSILEFRRASAEARSCLELYEAANAHRKLYNGTDVGGEALADERALADVLSEQDRKGKTLAEQRETALSWAMLTVSIHVREHCFPALYRQRRQTAQRTYETFRFFQGWGFRSLLGAMYLQMMWLMTSGSAVRQCEYEGCFNTISFDSPIEDSGMRSSSGGKYRTRRDKRFCSKNCAQLWRYHNVIKPQRQAKNG